jgi:hypothetical protein
MRSFSFEEGEALVIGEYVSITVVDIEDDQVLLKIEGIDEDCVEVINDDQECVTINIQYS